MRMILLRSVGTALVMLGVSLSAHAQATASATANATVTVIQPISVAKNKDLAFGTLVKPGSGSGTATISNAGVRSVASGVQALSSTTPSQAQFTITGEGGQSISVTVPSSVTLASGANSLNVSLTNDMTGSASSQVLSGAIGASGTLTVNVGGSVTLPSTQATGVYSATVTLTASYN
jgi:hypothetical protein